MDSSWKAHPSLPSSCRRTEGSGQLSPRRRASAVFWMNSLVQEEDLVTHGSPGVIATLMWKTGEPVPWIEENLYTSLSDHSA